MKMELHEVLKLTSSIFSTVLLFGKCAVIIVLLAMLVKVTERGLHYVVGRLSQQMVID